MPSSVIASFEYNPETFNLRIVFVSGLVYDYKNVPEQLYLEMKSSRAKGIFLNQKIKGKYHFEKVE